MAQLPQKFLRVNKPYLNYIFSLTGRVKLNNFIVLSIVGIFFALMLWKIGRKLLLAQQFFSKLFCTTQLCNYH